jgi:two-component system, chemotaxis family, response regulator Rcp1
MSEVAQVPKAGKLPVRHVEILIVESDPSGICLTEMGFKEAGLTSGLHFVRDGADALMYVRRQGKYRDAPIPDLIFLDLSLPRVNGLTVLKEIKSTPSLMHIQIVVSSGSDDPDDIRAVYALNGNCFMRKPNELPQFLRFIETCYEFWGSVVTLSPPNKKQPQA